MQFFQMFGVLIAVSSIERVECCTCLIQHPQEYYCSSDFVIKGRVLASETIERRFAIYDASTPGIIFDYFGTTGSPADSKVVYTVEIKKKYKGSDLATPKTTVEMISHDELPGVTCGHVYLTVNQDHVIMGDEVNGELILNACGYNKRSDLIKKSEFKGLQRYYKKTCDKCSVCVRFSSDDTCGLDTCPLDFDSDGEGGKCEFDFARCDQNKKGQCVWLGRRNYRRCKRHT